MIDAQSIVTAAAQLPQQERVLVVEALLDSLDAPDQGDLLEITEAWKQEVRRRSDEMKSGLVQPLPLQQVCADGEKLLDGGG